MESSVLSCPILGNEGLPLASQSSCCLRGLSGETCPSDIRPWREAESLNKLRYPIHDHLSFYMHTSALGLGHRSAPDTADD